MTTRRVRTIDRHWRNLPASYSRDTVTPFSGGVTQPARKLVLLGDSTFDHAPVSAGGGKWNAGPAWGIYEDLIDNGAIDLQRVEPKTNGDIVPVATAVGSRLENVTVLDFGSNGASLGAWLAGGGRAGALVGDLPADANCVVLRYGINDIRLGACSENTLYLRIKNACDLIETRCPDAWIVLCVPNPFTTDDVGATGFVTAPAGGNLANWPAEASSWTLAQAAQAYTTAMRNAYLRVASERTNYGLLDLQSELFGEVCRARGVATWGSIIMQDILHPSVSGQRHIGELIADYLNVQSDCPATGKDNSESDPLMYKPRRAKLAQSESYPFQWSIYGRSVLDQDDWDILAEGVVSGGGANHFDVNHLLEDQIGTALAGRWPGWITGTDIICVGNTATTVGSAAGVSGNGYMRFFKTPGTDYRRGARVFIARNKYARSSAFKQAATDIMTNNYQRQGFVAAVTTNMITISAYPGEPVASSWVLDVADVMCLGGASFVSSVTLPLTGATFGTSGNNITVTRTNGFFTTVSGFPVGIYGTRAANAYGANDNYPRYLGRGAFAWMRAN